jgi:hypothetical protein
MISIEIKCINFLTSCSYLITTYHIITFQSQLILSISNRHSFQVLILRQPIPTPLSSYSTLFYASKRCFRGANHARIHSNHSDLQFSRHPHHSADILAEEVTREAQLSIVGERESFGFSGEGEDCRQRAESFVGSDGHAWMAVCDDSRLVEVPLEVFRRLAAGSENTAFTNCVLDVGSYLLDGASVDERTLAGAFCEAKAELECFDLGHKLRCEFLDDGGVDEESICALSKVNLLIRDRLQIVEMGTYHTSLTCGPEFRHHCTRDC